MKGTEQKLVQYMEGSDKRFVIPVYQRNYDWKTENCKQLFDDLVKVIRKSRKSHFFGSIVSAHVDDSFNEFLIIDGQQRLTTVSLLLLALYNVMIDGKAVPAKGNLPDRILKTYLIDEWQEDETRIKLKPVKNDQNAFGKLFGDKDEYIPGSNITANYKYFYERIQRQEITVDELFDAVCRLEIINISLSTDDNPQLIFESLNSTGLALSEGDKIRNFILMGLPAKLQSNYYENYWNKIEICTGYEVSSFIRDYLSVKEKSIPSINRVYLTFKNYVDEHEIETEELLKDLLNYAKWYKILLGGETDNKQLNTCIYRLNRMDTTVTRPFLLEVLRMKSEEKISLDETAEIFLTTETYIFRRIICGIPTNALNKIFVMLHPDIVRLDGTTANYIDKFKYILLSKKESGRFPNDNEFVSSFEIKPIYQMNSKNKAYIFERFENFDTIEDKDIYRHIDDGDYSIEHIMPQHLTPNWQESLGEAYEEIHETWLHRIANLTLTGYNSKYSNSPFEEKKNMDHGFAQSGLRMNTFVASKDKWTLEEIEERNSLLMKQALKIWPAPSTDYVPAEKAMDYCTLADDYDVTGRLLAKFSFKNTEYPVTSWIDMFERFIRLLYEQDKSIIVKVCRADAGDELAMNSLSYKPDDLREPLKIDDGVYLEKNTSNFYKVSTLRKLAKLYDIDESDIVFYLRDSAANDDKDEPERYTTRRKYWAYALPFIQKANEDTGCFKNCNPGTSNWMDGYFRVSGFCITCVANQDSAAVMISLSKSDKAKNKSAFDYLYMHKDEIEKKLNMNLDWQRSENYKASYIVLKSKNFSITDESNWEKMAQFHAEWSKKFYDAFVPLLQEWSKN